jgi:ABC-type glycerol-3-phosphate transport system substrate-binding protein
VADRAKPVAARLVPGRWRGGSEDGRGAGSRWGNGWGAIRHLTTPEALAPFARIGRILPADRSVRKEAEPPDGRPAGFKRAFLDAWDELAIEPPFVPRWPDVQAIWQEELDRVWTGERPAREGAAALKARFDQHLQQLAREGLL